MSGGRARIIGAVQILAGLFLAFEGASPWLFPSEGRRLMVGHWIGIVFGLFLALLGIGAVVTGLAFSRWGRPRE